MNDSSSRSVSQTLFALLIAMALFVAGCAAPSTQIYTEPAPRIGTIESIQQITQPGGPPGLGAVGGAVVGGLLGSLIGAGTGKTVATVVGAVGGGIVGNEVQKNNTYLMYQISVRYDDGSSGIVTQRDAYGLRVGDRVRLTDAGLSRL